MALHQLVCFPWPKPKFASLAKHAPVLLLLLSHFMICHSNNCHRPRTSSCHKEQRGGTEYRLTSTYDNICLLLMSFMVVQHSFVQPGMAGVHGKSPTKGPLLPCLPGFAPAPKGTSDMSLFSTAVSKACLSTTGSYGVLGQRSGWASKSR